MKRDRSRRITEEERSAIEQSYLKSVQLQRFFQPQGQVASQQQQFFQPQSRTPQDQVAGTLVVCPVCFGQHLYTMMQGYAQLQCLKTGNIFEVLYARVRAKNQHSYSRRSNEKIYQIRLVFPDRSETLVTFRSRTPRFELRAGDTAIISYYQKKSKIVQNCTIHQYMVASDGCFIATSVYGSYEAHEVLILRAFRDQSLASSEIGRLLISWYYLISPFLVRLLNTFPFAKKPLKLLLDEIVKSIRKNIKNTPK